MLSSCRCTMKQHDPRGTPDCESFNDGSVQKQDFYAICSKTTSARDVCGSEIPTGERYVVRKIPKQRLQIIEELTTGIEPGMRPTMDVDSEGNLRLDICLNCHMSMDVPGAETIN